MNLPSSYFMDEIDPDWAYEQALWIADNIPILQVGSSSGKFNENYISWAFHKSSSVPLIQKFIETAEKYSDRFEKIFGQKLCLDFPQLHYSPDAHVEPSIWHKDGYFWWGQVHLAILGNSNVQVRDNEIESSIWVRNGTIWFLNASEYLHKIGTRASPRSRWELTCPVNMRQEFVTAWNSVLSPQPEKWVNTSHPDWPQINQLALQVNKAAYTKGTWTGQLAEKPVVWNEDLNMWRPRFLREIDYAKNYRVT